VSLRIRRGGGSAGPPPPPPPPATEFGPINGPQWVRDHATPGTITVPGGAIQFTSEADLVTKVAANPSNSNFVSLSGGYYPWTSQYQETTKHPNIYWLPGTVVDGQNNSSSGITGFTSEPGSVGFTMYGGEFKNFWRVFSMNGSCKLEDALIHDCYEKGFNFGGNSNRVSRSIVHSCGRYNFSMFTSSGYATGNVLEYVQSYNGNTRLLDPSIDAGGSKMIAQDGLQVRYCWAHDNYGSGLWWDGNNRNVQVSQNVCENNNRWGIFYELGFGGTNIYRNACFNNANNRAAADGFGTAQLLSSGCDATSTGNFPFIDIYQNWIDGDGTQIQMGIVNHPGHGTSKGTHYHDNDVWDRGTSRGRMTGLSSSAGTIPLDPASDNTWENNHYHVLTGQTGVDKFMWGTDQNVTTNWQTFTQWKAAGRDDTGTLVTI